MKQLLLIFVLIKGCLSAQVGPPSLRCLEVLPNGNVKLTWVPPADPNNQFDSYEIWCSTSAISGYSLAGTVGALVLTNFTHNITAANTQGIYYYMLTNYTAGVPGTSAHSDTLRSIFVSPTQSVPDVKINYNHLKFPRLLSSAPTYTISREYPSASWVNIGTTPENKYADTLTICTASVNYQVALQDASGCVSLSNIKGDILKDTKPPDEPPIDSISVLPNGMTVIAWRKPRDNDICKYRVYYKNITNNAIDSVLGMNNTIYNYTVTTAATKPVQLFIAGIDCCNNIGSFNQLPTTMYLETFYNICDYSTNLSWNAYQGMPKGVLEYKVYYSVNGSAFLPVGTTTNTSFIHKDVEPGASICYYVRVFNTDRTISSSSNRACFFSTQALAPSKVYLRNVTIEGNKKAQIKIFMDNSKSSSGIDLMRSTNGVDFRSITFIPFTGEANYEYADEEISPRNTSYFYRAVVRDSCGNPRIKSNVAKTVLLKIEEDKENVFVKNLHWTAYQGYAGGVAGYNVYRVVNDAVSGPVGFTGPSDTTYADNVEDEAPNGANIKYFVEAVEGISNPDNFMEISQSNVETLYMEGKIFVPTAFAPNGVNKVWRPVTHFVEKTEYKVMVFDRWGSKVFETADDREGWDGSNARSGVYAYLISYKNSRGEYKELKGTLLMLE